MRIKPHQNLGPPVKATEVQTTKFGIRTMFMFSVCRLDQRTANNIHYHYIDNRIFWTKGYNVDKVGQRQDLINEMIFGAEVQKKGVDVSQFNSESHI